MSKLATIATVQFTGNAKTYDYVVIGEANIEAVKAGATGGQGICRVVVPGKIKEDGVLSLSIATVVSSREIQEEEAQKLYPVVQAIHPQVLDYAKVFVTAIDAAKAPTA